MGVTLPMALQASNSDRDENSRFFFLSLHFIFLSPSTSLHTSLSRVVLSSGCAACSQCVLGGWRVAVLPSPQHASFVPHTFFTLTQQSRTRNLPVLKVLFNLALCWHKRCSKQFLSHKYIFIPTTGCGQNVVYTLD